MAAWENELEHRVIAELSAWDHCVNAENEKEVLEEALERLHRLQLEQKINQLLDKSKKVGLNEGEKQALQALLLQR